MLQSQDKPVRFKDSRANEQAEKLREKLRERQLSGAAQNDAPETILVPCHVSPFLLADVFFTGLFNFPSKLVLVLFKFVEVIINI